MIGWMLLRDLSAAEASDVCACLCVCVGCA